MKTSKRIPTETKEAVISYFRNNKENSSPSIAKALGLKKGWVEVILTQWLDRKLTDVEDYGFNKIS